MSKKVLRHRLDGWLPQDAEIQELTKVPTEYLIDTTLKPRLMPMLSDYEL
jgi:hypothetical protein